MIIWGCNDFMREELTAFVRGATEEERVALLRITCAMVVALSQFEILFTLGEISAAELASGVRTCSKTLYAGISAVMGDKTNGVLDLFQKDLIRHHREESGEKSS